MARITDGFTIVETLVAISVLMIAVAGPLVVASRGLFGADLARDQMIAAYLAQESMESFKNIRDNNIYTSDASNWLSGLNTYTYSNPGDISALDGSSNNPSIMSCTSGSCRIYKETNGYGHVSSGATATIFSRRFYVHDPPSRTASCSSSDECGVTVVVDWSEANVAYSIVLTSEITSTIR